MDKELTYKNLREEIMYHIKKQDAYTTTGYTVALSIWTVALSTSNEWVALMALFVLVPLSIRIYNCRYAMAFCSSYMAAVLEEKSQYGWELMRERYYKKHKRLFPDNIIYLFSQICFWMLSLVSSIMFWAIRGFDFKICNYVWLGHCVIFMQIAVIVFQISIGNRYADLSQLKKEMSENWNELVAEQRNH